MLFGRDHPQSVAQHQTKLKDSNTTKIQIKKYSTCCSKDEFESKNEEVEDSSFHKKKI